MEKSFKKIACEHSLLIIFLVFYFLIIAFKLLSHPTPFFDWDESINAQVGREMITHHSIVPLWQDKVWLDKPPLPFLLFGIIMKITPFAAPEVSLRFLALVLSTIALILIYSLFLQASKNKFVALVTAIITSFSPIFLQRSQILNLDVFLIIGWLGYLLFVQNFWLSLFFLAVGVLSKSLLGFYPAGLVLAYYLFLFVRNRLASKKLQKIILNIAMQVGILSLWYLIMLLVYGKAFWQQHIIESHFHRVTESIESHFGKKTYYLDVLFEQLGVIAWISLAGLFITLTKVIKDFFKGRDINKYLYSLFLLPWFIFLNLTKTKIFWYLYPAIPQFAFLAVLPLLLLKKQKILFYLLGVMVILFIFQQNFIKTNFFSTFYSQPEDYYRLSNFAKDQCDSLAVLVGKDTRDATNTLEAMGLTITSTKQWGDHPSVVYYFGKNVIFSYDKRSFITEANSATKNNCLVVQKNDLDSLGIKMRFISTFGNYNLLKR